MEISTEQPKSALPELQRRQKATASIVKAMLVGVVLLLVIAYLSPKFLVSQPNPSLHWPVLITILIMGLGSIALRRTKFAVMRLQDIAALKGASGLLITLQRTTFQVALIASATALIGFVMTLRTGDPSYSYRAGVVAILVLVYCYPVRSSWEKAMKRFAPGPQSN